MMPVACVPVCVLVLLPPSVASCSMTARRPKRKFSFHPSSEIGQAERQAYQDPVGRRRDLSPNLNFPIYGDGDGGGGDGGGGDGGGGQRWNFFSAPFPNRSGARGFGPKRRAKGALFAEGQNRSERGNGSRARST